MHLPIVNNIILACFPMKIVCVLTTQWIYWRWTKYCSFQISCCYRWTWPIFLKIQNFLSLFLKEKSVLFAQFEDTEIPTGLTWMSYKVVIFLCVNDTLCSVQNPWFLTPRWWQPNELHVESHLPVYWCFLEVDVIVEVGWQETQSSNQPKISSGVTRGKNS